MTKATNHHLGTHLPRMHSAQHAHWLRLFHVWAMSNQTFPTISAFGTLRRTRPHPPTYQLRNHGGAHHDTHTSSQAHSSCHLQWTVSRSGHHLLELRAIMMRVCHTRSTHPRRDALNATRASQTTKTWKQHPGTRSLRS